ncbi:MAG: type II toxin-antitoxin system VapC family toxin [Prevotellaceae bacterium]|nr:type II toxin-antitoxin system VapC family toxin [Prevotellaceae bacterium]
MKKKAMEGRKLTLYLDTSVIGGYYDDEFQQDTQRLFQTIKNGKYDVAISDLTLKELIKAPQNVKTLLHDLAIDFKEVIASPECVALANEYLKEKVVGQTSLEDCIHIATATVHKIDILVSWNFKHIVNIQRIRGYNAINIKNGYVILEIRSPKDLISYENKEEI